MPLVVSNAVLICSNNPSDNSYFYYEGNPIFSNFVDALPTWSEV